MVLEKNYRVGDFNSLGIFGLSSSKSVKVYFNITEYLSEERELERGSPIYLADTCFLYKREYLNGNNRKQYAGQFILVDNLGSRIDVRVREDNPAFVGVNSEHTFFSYLEMVAYEHMIVLCGVYLLTPYSRKRSQRGIIDLLSIEKIGDSDPQKV